MSDPPGIGPADDPDVPRDPLAVPEAELQWIFETRVAFELTTPALDDTASLPAEQLDPEVVFLVAQPGAGATLRHARVRREFEDRGGIIEVSVDALRRYHPDYETIRDWSPEHLPELTEPAARWFANRAAHHLRQRGFNVLVEDIRPEPDEVMSLAEAYAASGYHVRVAALAVPPVLSRLILVEGFAAVAQYAGIGPWTPAEVHDAAYAATADIIQRAETSPTVARITVDTWHGPLHDAERDADGTWTTFEPDRWVPTNRTALQALVEARDDPLSTVQRQALANRLAATLERLDRLDPRHIAPLYDMGVQIRNDLQLGAGAPVATKLDYSLEYLDEALGDVDRLQEALGDLQAANRALDIADAGPDLAGPEPPPIDPGPDTGPDIGPP